jgi:hypothetical protein
VPTVVPTVPTVVPTVASSSATDAWPSGIFAAAGSL